MLSSHFAIGILTAVMTAATVFPASAASLEEIKSRGSIIVGIDFSHPPFAGVNTKNDQEGSDLETAQLLAKDLGVKLETVNVSGPNRIPFLLSNKVDIVVAAISITKDRLKVIDISTPYGVIPLNISAPKEDLVKAPADLAGKSIAVASGVTADIELVRSTKDIPGVEIVRYADESTTRTAILTGQQKYLASTLSDLGEIKKQKADLDLELKFTLKTYPMGIGIKKNSPELLDWTNKWVEANIQSGKLNDIFVKWFGQPLPADMKSFDIN